jgi:hypothetical protein
MSVLPPRAEVAIHWADVRYVPVTDIGRGALVQVDPGIVVRKRLATISLLYAAARQSVDIRAYSIACEQDNAVTGIGNF